ncbi:MAG: Asp-tRNA(Asn)/Glu-tRNA(Gln) amidotransferase subunit GatC [Desulforegulaceae bacterium]|jgi:aspartyl-tRNA(Asn)/glutamyl-tRNA(Gln) amidotransferase subunit C|nr:Asp-tRNA(Asn)/Glu-tRNA(Gln) amidotransferase subunit GatC [Desulforegulaceae bacterium]
MTISRDEVLYVAHLARLEIPPEEMEGLSSQIDDILSYVATLKEADTKNVDPTAQSISLVNRFREDIVGETLGSDKAVSNCQDNYDGMFVVPKVVKS